MAMDKVAQFRLRLDTLIEGIDFNWRHVYLNDIMVQQVHSSKENPYIQKCYDLGVNSYVVKPIAFKAFQKAISAFGLYAAIIIS